MPFECMYCPRTFRRPNDLSNHLNGCKARKKALLAIEKTSKFANMGSSKSAPDTKRKRSTSSASDDRMDKKQNVTITSNDAGSDETQLFENYWEDNDLMGYLVDDAQSPSLSSIASLESLSFGNDAFGSKPDKPDNKLYNKNQDSSFSSPARHFGRVHVMWLPYSDILHAGQQDSPGKTEKDFSQKRWALIQIYRELIKDIPDVHQLIKNSRGDAFRLNQIAKMLDKKRSDARNEDVQRLKNFAQRLSPMSGGFVPPLMLNDKRQRGFKHPQLARLVCPVTWLNEFDTDAQFRQKLFDGKITMTHDDLPLLLFDEDKFDLKNLIGSFLRNKMLVRGWRMVFIGPTAADSKPTGRTRKGNAARNGMRHVTINCIAYIATIVYFALSSDETMQSNTVNKFNYSEFYNVIVKIMKDYATPAQQKDLLNWWDRQVFPSYANHSDGSDGQERSFDTTAYGMILAQFQLEESNNDITEN